MNHDHQSKRVGSSLDLGSFSETGQSGSSSSSGSGTNRPGATRVSDLASTTLPNTNSLSFDSILATESAAITSVRQGLKLPGHLPQTGTISDAVFTRDTDLLGSSAHGNFCLLKTRF
eukprot:Blabericola_migrator_1__1490@NODE_1394_length_4632_cov_181_340854_g933_i0_p5_GENE_NODE_1394_length_4632_cov_181_340854_g933_i0NODE_1394_length_4632_cov_181_340854_g933_i0_p5_ORF_typecomplete_len117_score0_35Gram_pos_anchor/PF00746_21/4_9e03Gram_pos_anchor/PF00746_21/3_2e02Gram_pos_anchor/PF00746_21/0_98_NODE_1394_length_4632_cov_181_340854_g933_i042354585